MWVRRQHAVVNDIDVAGLGGRDVQDVIVDLNFNVTWLGLPYRSGQHDRAAAEGTDSEITVLLFYKILNFFCD